MLRILGGLLLLAVVVGLLMTPAATTASSPLSSGGGSQREIELRAAVAKLHRGMTEDEVRERMKGIADDFGKIYFGGTGHSRLYFALPGKRQLWLDLGGTIDNYKVVIIGRIEPKQTWLRYEGDSIVVEDITF